MPPKAAPTFEQLYASFTEKVEEFDDLKSALDTLGEVPSSEDLGELKEIKEAKQRLGIPAMLNKKLWNGSKI